MVKKEKIVAIAAGIILYVIAAIFSISLVLSVLDFGSISESNVFLNLGKMLGKVYGITSIFIPAFFIFGGIVCFESKKSVAKIWCLLISVLPFFTLFFAEKVCRRIYSLDTSPVAFLKIFSLAVIAILLAVFEYLLTIALTTKKIQQENEKDDENSLNLLKKFKHLKKDDWSFENLVNRRKNSSDEEIENSVDEAEVNEIESDEKINSEETVEENKIIGTWSLDENGDVKTNSFAVPDDIQEVELSDILESEKYTQNEISAEEIESDEMDIIDRFENEALSLSEDFDEKFDKKNDGEDEIVYDISFDEPVIDEDHSDLEYEIIDEEKNEVVQESDEDVLNEMKEIEEELVEEEIDSVADDLESENNEDEFIETEEIEEEQIPAEEENFEDEEPQEEFEVVEENDEEISVSEKSIVRTNGALEDVFAMMDEDVKNEVLEDEGVGEDEIIQEDEKKSNEPKSILPKKTKPLGRGPYKISYELLKNYDQNSYWEIDDETKQSAENLKETLKEFKIEAEITGIQKGPVITMFEILPAPGVKLSKIVGLADNIALRLAAQSIRIVAPIPGKRAVGIEVPNESRAIVGFRECIEQPANDLKKMAVPVVLGKDIEGKIQLMDLVKTPHLLIAGATGAGKSVCVNSIILSILYKRSPNDVKMILIDPKVVELKLYNGIPHLLTPVITEPKKAMQALQYCLCEMERRYALLDSLGCREISSYNRKIEEQHICTDKLPYLIVIIDEFADLMATTGKSLEAVVARLCAMSRAVGIHLVLATQRPSVDVITGLIKANIPSRIAFMVAQKMDSRIIIDQVGAEKLLGKGDMLYASSTDPFPVRIQGALVEDDEVERVVSVVKEWGEPEYIDDEIFVDDDEDDNDGQLSLFGEAGDDPLYEKALDIVIQDGRASASYIQRRLSIGYNRAARLVELMEERGIVGPANGSKPREIIHVP